VSFFSKPTIIALVAIIAFFTFVNLSIQISPVVGSSMWPGLENGQVLIINKLAYLLSEPQRGDIIVFDPPDNIGNGNEFIKRVIGLPGETVRITNGIVYVEKANGDTIHLDEPYVKNNASYDFTGDPIKEGEYFVLGDNRINSLDSRSGWTVPEVNIVGKAWFSIWPISRLGGVPNYALATQ